MRQYFLILADAELELVPTRIVGERCVLNSARARNKIPEKMLLDASHHHPAFGKLRDGDRRGRPDLVHMFLLLSLDSDANAEGRLRVFVHTRNDDVVAVKPDTRLPPNYIRFVGLIEQLFDQQVVPSRENALLELRQKVPLATLVEALKPDSVIVIDPAGERTPLEGAIASAEGERVVIIMGGFSKGTFSSDMRKLKTKRVSLGERPLKVWTISSKTLRALEVAESAPEPLPKPTKKKPAKPAAKESAAKKSSAKKSSGARRARKKPEE
ncbi:MAG TPA: 16S rRNA methyltransferase [Thermoplasmata archaeon]|nr:16S rRNA methyltransferase [Thermoplasmata archaeon]